MSVLHCNSVGYTTIHTGHLSSQDGNLWRKLTKVRLRLGACPKRWHKSSEQLVLEDTKKAFIIRWISAYRPRIYGSSTVASKLTKSRRTRVRERGQCEQDYYTAWHHGCQPVVVEFISSLPSSASIWQPRYVSTTWRIPPAQRIE